jgi:hypothetical protein
MSEDQYNIQDEEETNNPYIAVDVDIERCHKLAVGLVLLKNDAVNLLGSCMWH